MLGAVATQSALNLTVETQSKAPGPPREGCRVALWGLSGPVTTALLGSFAHADAILGGSG